MIARTLKALLAAGFLLVSPAYALFVDTPLPDSAQEEQARALFLEFRCVVCQGESIADSSAAVAQDLRLAVREMVAQGKSDEEIKSVMVSRYGEYVLMTPSFKPHNYLLWLGPALIMLLGGAVVFAYFSAARIQGRS